MPATGPLVNAYRIFEKYNQPGRKMAIVTTSRYSQLDAIR